METTENGVTVFVSGRFDFKSTQQFLDLAESGDASKAKELRIDFKTAEYLDSSAIGCLLRLHANSAKLGRKIVLTNAFGHVDSAIRMANLDKIFTMV
jgi:anti-anti-sigma factor